MKAPLLNVSALISTLLLLALAGPLKTYAQNAPVTTAATAAGPGPSITVPVYVSDFVDIGAISLTLQFDPAVVQVSSITPNVNLPGFTGNWTASPGKLTMAWYGLPGVTLANNSVLVSITFTGLATGQTALTWFDDGHSCEYAKYDNGAYNVLNDIPASTYYIPGQILWAMVAPQTIAGTFTNVTPGSTICVPVTVNQFNNIGAISLTMHYDPLSMTYLGAEPEGIPENWFFSVQSAVPGTVAAGGYGPGFSLENGELLFTACFAYHCGNSAVTWDDANGTSCEYADATTLTPLYDLPTSAFYIDGSVSGPALDANFSASKTNPAINETVIFTDLSTGGANSWTWSFSPSTLAFVAPTTEHSKNPQVKFLDGGPYTVTLTATNACLASNTETKTDYIWVGTPGIWTGDVSTNWFGDVQNWDDHRVPTNQVDVIIPAARPNWPWWKTTDGADFIIGTHCKSLTIQPGADMTVDGNVILTNTP